jgi:hypothetical protein
LTSAPVTFGYRIADRQRWLPTCESDILVATQRVIAVHDVPATSRRHALRRIAARTRPTASCDEGACSRQRNATRPSKTIINTKENDVAKGLRKSNKEIRKPKKPEPAKPNALAVPAAFLPVKPGKG